MYVSKELYLLSMNVVMMLLHSKEDILFHWSLSNGVPVLSSKHMITIFNGFKELICRKGGTQNIHSHTLYTAEHIQPVP